MGRRMMPSVLALAAWAFACSDPLEFADWTIPVPEGTRIVEYADATDRDREGSRIEVVEDLVIAPRADDDNYLFYQPTDVLTDSDGRIYVFDSGKTRVQVFDPDGTFLRTLGREGSGPGEFRSQGGFVTVYTIIAADHLIAYDYAQSRLSVWDSAGTHVDDRSVTGIRFGPILAGLDDGSFVAVTTQRADEVSNSVVVAVSEGGEQLRSYISLPRPDGLRIGGARLLNPAGAPVFASSSDGTVYASAGDQYQVLAVGPDLERTWALRVAHEPAPFTDEHRARALEALSRGGREVDASGAAWPTNLGAISHLAVDGHGHLYVFGFVAPPPFAQRPQEFPVDVYARDGERLILL